MWVRLNIKFSFNEIIFQKKFVKLIKVYETVIIILIIWKKKQLTKFLTHETVRTRF